MVWFSKRDAKKVAFIMR